MRYFNTGTEIRAIEPGQDSLINNDWPEMTEADLEAFRNIPTPFPTVKAEIIQRFENLAEAHIQSFVTAHDLANITTFRTVDTCFKYKDSTTHPSAQFCKDIWAYNDLVWSTLRLKLIDVNNGVINMPASDVEFMTLLPTYTGAI